MAGWRREPFRCADLPRAPRAGTLHPWPRLNSNPPSRNSSPSRGISLHADPYPQAQPQTDRRLPRLAHGLRQARCKARDRPLQRPAGENRFASVVMSERESFFDELKRRNVIRMAGLYLRFQALLKLPAAGEKDIAHE